MAEDRDAFRLGSHELKDQVQANPGNGLTTGACSQPTKALHKERCCV